VSAAAPHPPASTGRVARHYLALLGRGTGLTGIVLAVLLMLQSTVNTVNFWAGAALPLVLMFFFPLFQWRGPAHRGTLDAAVPLDGVQHDLVRVACGAAWASLTMTVPIGLLVLLASAGTRKPFGGDPWWYPASLLLVGLTLYLFGSAVWLRAERAGRVLLVVFLGLMLGSDVVGMGTWGLTFPATEAELRRAGPYAWLGTAALWLAVAGACVWLAAAADRWLPWLEDSPVGRARMAVRRALARRALLPAGDPAPHRPDLRPRRPAPLRVVLWREVVLLRHAAILPVLLGLASVLQGRKDAGPEPQPSTQALFFVTVSFFWPLLVWMDGREDRAPLPVGDVARRLARVAAGAAWLGVVAGLVLAGEPAGVPWTAVLYGVLMMYLLGSLPVLLSVRHPIRHTLLWWLAVIFVSGLAYQSGLPTPWDPLADPPRGGWVGTLLWLAVTAVLTVTAAQIGLEEERGWAKLPPPGSEPSAA
jgi:hypothetical protein